MRLTVRERKCPGGARRGGAKLDAPVKLLARLCLVLLAAAPTLGAATVMYRYVNAQGDPVFSYTLPPDQAKSGYQRIDMDTGKVVESVAPELPPDELAEKLRREKAAKACQEELYRVHQLYGSESDIDHAREEALGSLDTRIEQLEANLRLAQRQQSQLQTQAANVERAGQEIPATLLQNMDSGRSQMKTLKTEIDQRRQEQKQAEERFTRERERFRSGTCPGTLADAHTAD